ncbi:MAG: hypothetical protein GWN31_03960, partial [Candidatus Thorarchaeota archaeon]|nr:hypothetical protein [Candidatus Thorarchaeota archaeon]NIW13088.1 hypothetical protein [Candidatus Thorarchaeota archaeon]
MEFSLGSRVRVKTEEEGTSSRGAFHGQVGTVVQQETAYSSYIRVKFDKVIENKRYW